MSKANDTTIGQRSTQLPTVRFIEYPVSPRVAELVVFALVQLVDVLPECCAIEVHALTLRSHETAICE